MKLRHPMSRLLRPWHFRAWGLALFSALIGGVFVTESMNVWSWLLLSLILYVWGIFFTALIQVDEKKMEEEEALKELNVRDTNLPEYAFNYFSKNPEVFGSQSKYVVKTNGWRSLFSLFAGSRKLRIRPDKGELSLSVRNYWLFTHSVVLPFNRIDHIHPAFAGYWRVRGQYGTGYTQTWCIKIVLRDPQEEIDLFRWEEGGGVGEPPVIPEKGEKGAEYEAVLNRLHQLTGAKISYE